MKTKNYFILCAAITATLVFTLLFIPAVSDTVEQLVLLFLSTNAR
jgi:Na+/melibiose symporter-like transporter